MFVDFRQDVMSGVLKQVQKGFRFHSVSIIVTECVKSRCYFLYIMSIIPRMWIFTIIIDTN